MKKEIVKTDLSSAHLFSTCILHTDVSVAQSVSAFGCYLNIGNRKVGGSSPPGDESFTFLFFGSNCNQTGITL